MRAFLNFLAATATAAMSRYRVHRQREAIPRRVVLWSAVGATWHLALSVIATRLPAGISPDLLYIVPIITGARYLPAGAVWYLAYTAGTMRAAGVLLPVLRPGSVTPSTEPASAVLIASILMSAAQYLVVAWLAIRLRRFVEQEARRAREDSLTGLMNRRAFTENLHRTLAKPHSRLRMSQSSRGALAYIDLDGFKAVNDRDGHEAGDAVLQLTANILRQAVRAGDAVARLGGDEFALWLPLADQVAAQGIAERALVDLRTKAAEHGWQIGASIGVVLVRGDDQSVPALLAAADAMMYEVKRNGKGKVLFGENSRAA